MTLAVRAVALGDQLASVLRQRIVRQEIAAGTHLVEDQLAAEHGVSRGPVRDALRTLTSEGLLESRRRGFFVCEFSAGDIRELYEIRHAAEQLACQLALAQAESLDWSDAERHLERMAEAAERGDTAAYAQADVAFHTTFYELSGNRRLLTLWRQFEPTFSTLLKITNAQDADLHPSYRDHVELLELARRGDVTRFSTVLRHHLAGSEARMSRAMVGAAPDADGR